MPGPSSIQRRTTSGVIGTSGNKIVLHSLSIRRGTAAVTWQLDIHSGIDATAPQVGEIGLDATQNGDNSLPVEFGPNGVLFPNGLFIAITDGDGTPVAESITAIYD